MNDDISKDVQRPRKRTGRPPKHGGYSLLTQAGELPENRGYIREYLTAVREGIIRDLGPREEDLTSAKLVILDRVIAKLGILRCLEEYGREKGVFRGGELDPAFGKNYIAFSNAIRLDLQALGIDKRQGEGVIDLGKYLETKATEAKGQGKASGAGEIVEPGAPGRDPGEKS